MSVGAIKIKGDKSGLWLILDKRFSFEVVEEELKDKLEKNLNFFSAGSKVNIVAKGFGPKARERMEALLKEHDISVQFMEDEPAKIIAQKAAMQQAVEQARVQMEQEKAQKAKEEMTVMNRTIRGGEEIIVEGSILICGNVNPGAQIIAGGNIDIRGKCRGIVHAGCNGDTNAIIVADNMMPMQIRIANMIARSPDDAEETGQAEKAYIKDGHIVVEAMVR